mmetsp:Transcript_15047/g.23581  ORF Transcript_15047/g.23581 Transcript_15047/m.23581 type:complete len:83 (+) Transcript_15047:136-384(+)
MPKGERKLPLTSGLGGERGEGRKIVKLGNSEVIHEFMEKRRRGKEGIIDLGKFTRGKRRREENVPELKLRKKNQKSHHYNDQ